MVLLGTKADNEKSIVKLTVSDDWHVVKQYHIGGRLDKTTYTLIEKAKEAEERASLAEQRAKMVEEASKETEALLKRKELEAEELAKRAKELEDAKKVDANGKYASKEVVRWECLVDSKYVEYPPSVASILTQHHRLGEKAAFSLHGKQYEIDFAVSSQLESWEQVNVESGFRRKVRIKKVTSFQHLVPSWQCNVDGGWVEYPRIVSQILEAQYAEGGNVSFALNNTAYELDFAKMQQMNITSKFTRPVRRELRAIPCDLGTTDGIPSNWTFKTKSCDCELVSVPISSEEWKFVDEKLRGSISNAKLKEVQRVQNIPLWKYFEFQKERLAAKSGSGTANVQFVWHGTRTTHPSLICTDTHDGFMMQRSRQGSWGQGIYFAANASYSNSYAFTQKGLASNNKTLILVRLAVGEEVRLPSDSTLRHCPAKANGTGRYDTVTGDINGSTIFVVYENGRGYPEYLVTYTEK
ncbi:WWE domain containing protein [Nitzschia inconspicua]|uniref:Poly [ADP-ribose] polymerase n=1 Tax=Nitzschia inconspicua TaxID=303405 RepID=A0A9K3LSM2_9STRA|nr:WWE domain containing protein [Nitzschia inconspicua]